MKLNKNNFIFFIASMAGGGFLARKLVENFPGMMKKMMKKMMEKMMSEGGSPMDMCKQMFEGDRGDKELAVSAAPELEELFEEWIKSMETSVLEFVKGKKKVNPLDIADHLNISLESSIFLINKLTYQGKLKIGSIEAIK